MKYIHRSQFVEELRQLCLERTEGMVFISTDKSELAQINLSAGEIVSLFFLNRHGMDALQLMKQITSCSYQLVRGLVKNSHRMPLPRTAEILDTLAAVNGHITGAMSTQVRTVMKETLNEFIGPIAAFVCNRRLVGVHNLEVAVEALAGEIPDRRDALQFRERLQHRLQEMA